MKPKKRALGRGLDAILQSPDTDITSKDISGDYVAGAIANISISKIRSNPFQPRSDFDRESMEELAGSIREQGIVQPLTVRKLGYDQYQLIAGERRLRASGMAGLEAVQCYIRVADDEQMLEMALIENIHRKDLNAIEIAISYQRLIEECDLTHEKLSERISKNRSTITNYLRLLKLPAEIQLAMRDDKISMGHARALINISDPEAQLGILTKIIARDLSVRQVEELVRKLNAQPQDIRKDPLELPEFFSSSAVGLRDKLGTNVNIRRNNNGKGHIVISFESDQDFSRILAMLD
ncbi:MAG: ParB/RepB/Spo0J family partition protein [Bacteroidales bacterium]|nr:ParB/RepB/Spo0J family partition protein [Bacteroidales bacterium]